jgi:hypothetical protein
VVSLDDAWVARVCAWCDPVLEAADLGFVRQVQHGDDQVALLWEAEPAAFAARYPDSGVDPESPCVDWWAYAEEGVIRLNLEGRTADLDAVLPLTGDGEVDGRALAAAFARAL